MEEPKDYEVVTRDEQRSGDMVGCLIFSLFGFGIGWAAHWIYTSLWS